MTTIKEIPVEELKVSTDKIVTEDNHRDLKVDGDFAELVASVKSIGILEPLLVRHAGGDAPYRLIAGHRRLAAAKKAGLDEVPVRVFPVTDAEADQIRAVENLHRKDLNPMEEAKSFEKLADKFHEAKAVASVVNKSEAYVHRALALLKIPAEVQKLIASGDLTAAHGHQIARAPEKQQASLAKFATDKNQYTQKYPTLEDLRGKIAASVERDLKKAPFPKDREYAGMVACAGCPQNSANQALLFDGAEDGRCTGPSCYAKKEGQFYQDFADKKGASLEGMKFLGFAKDDGYGVKIKAKGHEGAVILDEKALDTKAVKDRMKTSPGDFAWAVVKPGKWSEPKKNPDVVMVALDPSVLPKDAAPKKASEGYDQTEYKKRQFIESVVVSHLFAAVSKAFNAAKPKREHLAMMAYEALDHDKLFVLELVTGRELPKHEPLTKKMTEAVHAIVEKLTPAQMVHVVFLCSFAQWNIRDRAKAMGVDVKKVAAAAEKDAQVMWDDVQETSEKMSGKKVDNESEDKE